MQSIDHWEDQRSIQNLMGKYAYHFLLKREKDIFERFWSREQEDICLGFNHGWYMGRGSVKAYYQALAQGVEDKSRALQKAFPQELGKGTAEELSGVGQMEYIPLTSPIVEIADDRKTAKGIWTSQGVRLDVTPGGPDTFWKLSYLCCDFIREKDGWYLWHMRNLIEIEHPQAQKWYITPEPLPALPPFQMIGEHLIPKPDIEETLWIQYAPDRPFHRLPRLPEAYARFEETFSYGFRGGEAV